MNKVTSQFSFRTYLEFFLSLALLASLLYAFLNPGSFSKSISDEKKLFLAITLLVVCLVPLYRYFKRAYVVKIDNETISVRGLFFKTRIFYSDIRSIDFFSRLDLYWSSYMIIIGTRIELENGKEILIIDPLYKNIGEIKTCLVQTFPEKIVQKKLLKTKKSTQPEIESEYEKIAGNPHTSLNGIIFYSTIIIILVVIQQNSFGPRYFILLALLVFFYFVCGMQLHYFLVSNKHLVVRNHFIPWINRTYSIDDIIEANREIRYQLSDGLRITIKNFRSKLYPAGSLRQKHWNRLKEIVQNLNIEFGNV